MDYAAALQVTLERIVDHIVGHFQTVTGAKRLCLSGGVAHNCTMNGRLACSGRFTQIYVQPAAHDAGNALGAALTVVHDAGLPIGRDLMPNLFLGRHVGSSDEIFSKLQSWRPLIEFEKVPNAAHAAADLLAGGLVIGWVQGKSEFGPRALGNRSILADPRPAENKLIINAMVKKREEYRPFAPAVLEERLHDYFEMPKDTPAVPFMVIVLSVRLQARALLGAVTHVDGSARVQSVSRCDNPLFHALIERFGVLTGVPVVLNTSFNNNAEPIVDSVDDSIATLLTTGIHAVVMGDWLVRKPVQAPGSRAILNLSARVPPTHKLVRRSVAFGKPQFQIEATTSRIPGASMSIISSELFSLLIEDDMSSISSRCIKKDYTNAGTLLALEEEISNLWAARAVLLEPIRK
jgi:carbamoyltransferase